jgi:hypothetical protein
MVNPWLRWANPLYYPLAVGIAAIALILGVRLIGLPRWMMLILAVGIALIGAAWLKARQLRPSQLENPELASELQAVRQRAKLLADKAEVLAQEATQLLSSSEQLDLLASLQFACEHARELPQQLEQLAQRLQGSDSLLSVSELQQQLTKVKQKLGKSSEFSQKQLTQLAASLERNIQLALQGKDARQAQVVNLSTLILEAAEVLQQLQNKLRTANLSDREQTRELRSLSEAFTRTQENVDLLVNR